MEATIDKTGKVWTVTDGSDTVDCWLDKDGFHSLRLSPSSNGKRMIEHKAETVKWTDIISKAEGQLTLL